MRFGHFFYPMKFDDSDDARAIQECLEEAGLVEAWRELARMPETTPDGSQRAALSSLAGMVKLVLNQLHEHGMVQTLDTAEGEVYTATPRYRVQLRELAGHELFKRCAAALPGFLDGEER